MFRIIYQLKCRGIKKHFDSTKGVIFSKIVYVDRDIAEGAKAGFRQKCIDDSEGVLFLTALADHPDTVVTIVELELFE